MLNDSTNSISIFRMVNPRWALDTKDISQGTQSQFEMIPNLYMIGMTYGSLKMFSK